MVQHDEGFFTAKDNLRLFWESDVPQEPKAHVGIIHGYMDHLGRYKRVRDALTAQGFAVHAVDYRGHGQADGRRSHCDRFEDYLDDVSRFWARVQQNLGGKKAFMLAHSHGGLIASHLAGTHRLDGLAGLVLTSPLYGYAFTPPFIKVQVSKLIGKVIPWLPVKNPLKPSDLTRDPVLQREAEKDPLYNRVVTPRWFTENAKAQVQALQLAPKIHVPTFVLVSPDDPVNSPALMRTFFERLGSTDKKLKEYPGYMHELMNDLGKEEVWGDISNWILAHL
jgi:lysophospholipase